MAIRFTRNRRPQNQGGILPLINVIFLLLTFFVITGNYQEGDALEINAPSAKSGKDIADQPLKLILTSDGLVILNDIPIAPTKLYKELSSLLEKREGEARSLVIMADAKLGASTLMGVIADVQQAGVSDVSLVTKGL